MPLKIEINEKPLTLTQLKFLKEINAKVKFKCGFSNCTKFNGVHTIDEIDKHFKKEHLKRGLFYSSARKLCFIEETEE